MKTVRRLLHGEIIRAVAFVAIGFLALFMFFDLVEELQSLTRHAQQGYQLQHALLYIALKLPVHLYELLPLSVLIGTIFVMARLAQSSEFTILRTGGLDPLRALVSLLQLGLVFVTLTFVTGDYLAPWADRQALQLKGQFTGHLTLGQTGAWLKETQGERHFAVNVRRFDGLTHMQSVRIHEFNAQGQLLSVTTAAQATIRTITGNC
jgi:lipopolysaccharide export system permease protein